MEIRILQLLPGAKEAEGLTVVIDVFRAFSLACYVMHYTAKQIFPVADINLAYELKCKNPDYILIGERNDRKPEGFDYGNSPTHIQHIDFSNKSIVHTTSAGTQGLINSVNADERITGSFVNAPAIVQYIRLKNPSVVSLVCMGYSMKYPTEEDTFCAEYIKTCLEKNIADFPVMKEAIRKTSAKRLFVEENQSFSPASDFDLCTDLGRFNFILKVEEKNNLIKLTKLDIPIVK